MLSMAILLAILIVVTTVVVMVILHVNVLLHNKINKVTIMGIIKTLLIKAAGIMVSPDTISI